MKVVLQTFVIGLAFSMAMFVNPSISLGASVSLTAVGVYDAATNANTVSTDPGGTLASFTSDVATAFGNNAGGVIDFDELVLGGNAQFDTSIEALYGSSGSKNLSIGLSTAIRIYDDDLVGQVIPISGNSLMVNSASDVAQTLTIGAITGGDVGEIVTEFALTVLSRSNFPGGSNVATITANYSGGGSTVLVETIDAAIGTDDTFFRFVAPVGESITSIVLSESGGGGAGRLPVDDLAFITSSVPEPSSIIIGLLGFVGLVFGLDPRSRRRR